MAAASSPSSSPSAKTAAADASKLQPVQLRSTAASQAARHVLPIAVGALFFARFGRLVADPVSAMWSSLPLLALLQCLYAVACLPAAGSASAAAKNKKPRPGDKKKAADASGPSGIITALIALLLSLLLAPVLHATMILFGAPLLTHLPHTFLCAAHLSTLTFLPLFYVHGVDPGAWVAIAGFKAPLDECYGGIIGGFLGAWLGAVPIPLDWDREWQKWPVTILVGIYAGYLAGRIVGGSLLRGKRF